MIEQIKNRFKGFCKNGYYVKAMTEGAIDWNIGLDNNGCQSLKLRGEFEPQGIEETKIIGISQFQRGKQRTIIFSLLDGMYEEQFYYFCCDLLTSTKDAKNIGEAYRIAISRYIKWKKMFKNATSSFLSEFEIMGLIAEVSFLKDYMIPKYGESDAVKSWTGQELTKKDFTIEGKWYEIKAISKGKKTICISSLEQLDGNDNGFIIVYPMEKMSSVSGVVGLNELIKEVYDSIILEDVKEVFLDKISLQGFVFHDHYNDYRYAVSPYRRFVVKEDFPRIIASNVPEAIVKVEYEIDINGIAGFEL